LLSEKPEIGEFLAVIDAKIGALQRLRESLLALAAASVGALGQFGNIDPSNLPPSTAMAGVMPQTWRASSVQRWMGFGRVLPAWIPPAPSRIQGRVDRKEALAFLPAFFLRPHRTRGQGCDSPSFFNWHFHPLCPADLPALGPELRHMG
jgi:hypothetical protein